MKDKTSIEYISLRTHLAEQVMGAKFVRVVGGLEYFWFPTRDGRSVKRAFSLDGWESMPNQPAVWNPLTNASIAFELIQAAADKIPAVAQIFYESQSNGWEVELYSAPPSRWAMDDNPCRAICLACAKATGWLQEEESA